MPFYMVSEISVCCLLGVACKFWIFSIVLGISLSWDS